MVGTLAAPLALLRAEIVHRVVKARLLAILSRDLDPFFDWPADHLTNQRMEVDGGIFDIDRSGDTIPNNR